MLQRIDASKDKISSDPDAVQLLQRQCRNSLTRMSGLPDAPFNTGKALLIEVSRCAGTASPDSRSTGSNPAQQHLISDTEHCFSKAAGGRPFNVRVTRVAQARRLADGGRPSVHARSHLLQQRVQGREEVPRQLWAQLPPGRGEGVKAKETFDPGRPDLRRLSPDPSFVDQS